MALDVIKSNVTWFDQIKNDLLSISSTIYKLIIYNFQLVLFIFSSVVGIVRQNSVQMLNVFVAIPGSVPSKDLNEGLLLAAKEGYTECIDCLIKAGADIDTTDNSNQTPFYLAVSNNKIPSALFLLKAGNDCDILAKNGFAAIHIAVKKNLHECVQILLENGVNINTRDSQNNTPLILAGNSPFFFFITSI